MAFLYGPKLSTAFREKPKFKFPTLHFLRLCTTKYERLNVDNYTDTRMHLTNYAINKGSENFVKNNSKYIMYGKGSKRHLEWFKDNIEL